MWFDGVGAWRTVLGLLSAVLLLLGLMAAASAYLKAGPNVMPGVHNVLQGPTAVPLDGFTTPAGAYGFRKLRSAYAGAAVRLRRASDNAELDINFLGFTGFTGAPVDIAAAAAHCAATTCFIRTWYDQSGNARDLAQTVAGGQPQLVFACQNGLPCLQMTSNAQGMFTGSVTPTGTTTSISLVGNRDVGIQYCIWAQQNGALNQLTSANGAANAWWFTGGAAGTLVPAVPDAAWHAFQGVINGASSVASVDGTDTTGSLTKSTTAGAIGNAGPSSGSCRQAEMVLWDNYAITAAERTVLTNNQRAFWGF